MMFAFVFFSLDVDYYALVALRVCVSVCVFVRFLLKASAACSLVQRCGCWHVHMHVYPSLCVCVCARVCVCVCVCVPLCTSRTWCHLLLTIGCSHAVSAGNALVYSNSRCAKVNAEKQNPKIKKASVCGVCVCVCVRVCVCVCACVCMHGYISSAAGSTAPGLFTPRLPPPPLW